MTLGALPHQLVGNGAIIKATEVGTLRLKNITLHNVLTGPDLGTNLLSVPAFKGRSLGSVDVQR